jgi:hypothetical protein
MVGVECGVGHVAHAGGCPFLFSFFFSCVFGGALWSGGFLGVSVCGGMYHLP